MTEREAARAWLDAHANSTYSGTGRAGRIYLRGGIVELEASLVALMTSREPVPPAVSAREVIDPRVDDATLKILIAAAPRRGGILPLAALLDLRDARLDLEQARTAARRLAGVMENVRHHLHTSTCLMCGTAWDDSAAALADPVVLAILAAAAPAEPEAEK